MESFDSLLLNKTNSERGWSQQFINKRTKKYHNDISATETELSEYFAIISKLTHKQNIYHDQIFLTTHTLQIIKLNKILKRVLVLQTTLEELWITYAINRRNVELSVTGFFPGFFLSCLS